MVRATTILVDDHPAFRQGLHALLGQEKTLQVVGEAGGGLEAIELVRELSPDLVVMDISMPDLDGIAATQRILSEFPQIKVVALSVHSGKRFVREMLQAGATGYILKESASEELVEGIRTVLAGEVYLSKSISDLVISDYGNLLSEADGTIEESTSPILRTKLHRPPVTADIIPRTRLIEQLEKERDRTMTLISAPAGYGKSILASQWLEASRLSGAWVSLDEGDNDPREFLLYLLAALGNVTAGLTLRTESLLKAAELPPPSVLARYLLNDLDQVKEPLILVLDDYHRIKEKNIHDLLAELLRHPSPKLHLVLLTRRDPPLPLGNLRAYGRLTELSVRDLRFTVEETMAFLKRILHATIDENTALALEEKLEGWVTGLRLAAISMGRKENRERVLQELQESSHLASEYLLREVLSQIPASHSRYLMEISILDRFCASICDAVSESSATDAGGEERLTGRAFVDWLEKTNLFVIHLDDRNEWFRYHHLFKTLLQNELKRALAPEDITALQRRAGAWFAGQRLIDEAIHYYLAGGDTDAAVMLAEESRYDILNADRLFVFRKWLPLFPEAVIRRRPALLMARIWVYYHQFDIGNIPETLDEVEVLLGGDPADEPIRGEINFFRGYLAYFQNEGKKSLTLLERALAAIPEPLNEIRGQVEVLHGLANQMQGQMKEALETLHRLISTPDSSRGVRKTRQIATLVYINIISGDLDAASKANQQLNEVSKAGGYSYAEAWSLYLEGVIKFFQCDPERSIHAFGLATKQRYVLHTRASVDSMAGLAFCNQAVGRSGEAETAMALLFEYVNTLADPAFKMLANSCQIRLSILQGKVTESVSQPLPDPPPAENMVWWIEIPVVTHCRVLLARGTKESCTTAEATLRDLLALNRRNHNTLQTIVVLTLLAMVRRKQGAHQDSLTLINEAVALAAPGSIVQPFLELGPPMADLLAQLDPEGPAKGFVEKLLGSFDKMTSGRVQGLAEDTIPGPKTDPASGKIRDLLTRRESEILQHLAKGLGNRDIASLLFVSPETVKKHLYNIYRKLEVNSRVSAITKAGDLGLVK